MSVIKSIERCVRNSAWNFATLNYSNLLLRTIFMGAAVFSVSQSIKPAFAASNNSQDDDAIFDSDIDTDNPSDGDIIKLIDRLMKFRTGDSTIFRALQIFENHCSREVLEYVTLILNEEIEDLGHNGNYKIVEKGLAIFEEHAHRADLLLLKEFHQKVSSKMMDPKQSKAKTFLKTTLETLSRLELVASERPGISRSVHSSMAVGRRTSLSELMKSEAKDSPAQNLAYFVQSFANDVVRERRSAGQDLKIYARDELADRIIDVISRRKDRLPLLVGEIGVGREKVLYRLVQKILDRDFPKSETHEDLFGDAEVLVINTEKLKAHNQNSNNTDINIQDLQKWANQVQQKFRRRIILVMPNFNEFILTQTAQGETISLTQLKAPITLSEGMEVPTKAKFGGEEGYGYVPMIFTMPDYAYKGTVSEWIAKLHRGKYELLNVPGLKDGDIVNILQDQWLLPYASRYGVKIDRDALELSVRNAQRIFPDDSKVHAAIKVLQDVVISTLRSNGRDSNLTNKEPIRVTRKSVSEFIGKKLGVPVDPSDAVGIQKYKQDLKAVLNAEVIGQKRLVSDTVDVFVSLFQDPRRPVRSAVIMGPTGVGKTLLAKKLAGQAFGNEGAILELQGSAIQEKEQLWTYFGAGNGYISSKETKGILCDWLDDPARGKFGGVVVIDEAEKACSDFFTRLMEFLDNGVVVCGDGKPRFARNHLVLFTSNRGANIMFPPSINNWTNAEIESRLGQLDSEELKKYFLSKTSARDEKRLPTEILQRIDLFTPGAPMNRENAVTILKGSARTLEANAKNQDGIDLEIDDSLIEHFVDSRDYKSVGVRPIQREFEAFVVNYKAEILYQIQTGQVQSNSSKKAKISVQNAAAGAKVVVTNKNSPMTMRESTLPILPESDIKDPLNDPRFMDLVNRLSTELESEVYGQEETLRSIGSAVIAHRSDVGQSKRPMSVLMVGTTGSGKTEIGKALAMVLYGSKDRASVISLGEVVTDYDFIKIVGGPGTEIGLFEQALISNPDGGVVVMDEFSNMGGPNLTQKTALLKRFYEMLEEGSWTSPVTNKTYQLKKFTFLWTGNDGEKLFQGETADDTRLATWKEFRSKDKLHKLLVESGIPEAFLGRMADIIFMKPLVQDVMVRIVRKFLDPMVKRFESQGIKIEIDPDFAAQTAFSFFMNHRGARSIRDAIDIRIRGQLATAIIKTKAKYSDLSGFVFKLSMKDTMIRTRAYSLDKDGERKVLSEISVSRGAEKVGELTEDFTDYARKEYRYRARDAAVTAFHEAGHAIVNDPLKTGQKTAAITIIGGEMASGLRYLGYARYEEELKALGKAGTRDVFVSRIARAMAGQLAQVLAGYERDSGWGNDLLQMRTLTTRYALEIGLVPGLETAVLGEDGKVHIENLSDSQKSKVFKAVDRMFADAEQMARESLTKNWNVVLAIVRDLMKKGYITGERMEELRKVAAKQDLAWHIGWDKQKNHEKMRRGAEATFQEKTAKLKKSCQSFLSRKILGRY